MHGVGGWGWVPVITAVSLSRETAVTSQSHISLSATSESEIGSQGAASQSTEIAESGPI